MNKLIVYIHGKGGSVEVSGQKHYMFTKQSRIGRTKALPPFQPFNE